MRDNLKKPAKIVIASCLTVTMVAGGIFMSANTINNDIANASNWTETYGDANTIISNDMNQAITRSEFATLIANSVETHVTSIDYDSVFTDIKGHWAERNILICRELGIIIESEYEDARFNPDDLISSDEMVLMLERSLNIGAIATLNEDGTYSYGEATSMIDSGNVYINCGNTYYILIENFVPNSEISREEILDILGNKDEIQEQLDEEKPTTGTTTGTGSTSSGSTSSGSTSSGSTSSGSTSSGSTSSGSTSSGSSTNVNFTFNFELESTAYTGTDIVIETLGSNFVDVEWTVRKNGIDAKFTDVINGTLDKSGGTISIDDKGSYTLIATAKNSAGNTIVIERTVTMYSKLTVDFLIPSTTTVGNTFSFKLTTEGDLKYDIAWALKKDGVYVTYTDHTKSALDNTGGSISFNEVGKYTVG